MLQHHGIIHGIWRIIHVKNFNLTNQIDKQDRNKNNWTVLFSAIIELMGESDDIEERERDGALAIRDILVHYFDSVL